MPISRRQFFRGLSGQDLEGQQRRRAEALESYVRTHLLPYDFCLTDEQTATLLATVSAGVEADAEDEPLSDERRRRIHDLVEKTIEPWREAHWKAEDLRRCALDFVGEFFSVEASPEVLEQMREKFCVSSLLVLENEVRRRMEFWLSSLSDARVTECEGEALRELVFSELRSWC